ncbi:MAG: Gfo/Idh/MocA family oxidoreductase [Anaerolineales bacterium]|nr:Gfo/Idh/MocA family oxidoreductase [Anaerolineales bacterium]
MLKAAVIGVGAMGQHHVRIYNQLSSTRLAGVADADQEAGERIAQLYHTAAFTDYRQLLEETRPEIVTIAVPTRHHHQAALAALEAGCHVLIEKPIAATKEEAQELIERANILGRKLMVGHIVRFDPAVQALKARLIMGELGRIFEVRCRRLGPFPVRIQDVGVVIDLATHDLDMIRYLTGQEAVRVYAETEQRLHSAYEDILVGSVRLADGTIGVLDINWLTPTKIRELTVTGERGMFLVDHLTQDLYFYENAETNDESWSAISLLRGVSEGRMIRYPVHKYEPLKAELEGFIQAILEDKPVPVSGEDGMIALRLAQALVQSGREGKSIAFNS